MSGPVCAPTASMVEFQPKEFGDYVLQDRIGAGGMAEIFLAASKGIEGFEKRLVIKRILPTLSDDDQFVRMFIEEAKLCVALRHPNIVQVYDLGVIDYQYYIAMEYVDGRDLLKTLAACGKKKIGFPTDIALHIVMESLKGLQYAHHLEHSDGRPLGIIHRDVSPSNLLLSFEGEVKIGDFGIAKASTREKTATGILKGKFGYMAPEQVTGASIDYRADVFAMGIVLYELLTGHRLFAGKNDLLVLERVRDAVIDPLPRHYRPDLDDELEGIVLKALAKRPDDRFQSAEALHDAIHDYVYRSRALVGPAQLGRFMQSLFLSEPEEIERRNRVRLPPVPPIEQSKAQQVGFGYEATEDEGHLKARFEQEEGDGKTPLLNLEEASALSEVVYISEEYDWDAAQRDADATRNEDSALVQPQPLDSGDQEHTVQTQVGIEVSDSDVESIAPGSEPYVASLRDGSLTRPGSQPSLQGGFHDPEPYAETQTPDPKGEVLAIRHARVQNDPTDYDLEKTPGYQQVNPGAVQVHTAPTRDDMPAADRNASIATALHDDDPFEDEDATRTGGVEPAEIVERTRVTPEEPAQNADAEATVQFDSTIYPALRDDPVPQTTSQPVPQVPLLDGLSAENVSNEYLEEDARSDCGTMEVQGSDMPTLEVNEVDLDALTDGPEEGTEVAFAPIPSAGPQAALPNVEDYDEDEEHDEDDDTQLREDHEGEIAALLANHSVKPARASTVAAEDDEDEASRTDLFNPVEEGMVAQIAGQASAMPARRQPLTGRRSRPVLLPADGEAAPLPRRSSSQPAFGRGRSGPRRRVATRVPLSVVNPDDTNRRQAIPLQVREEPESRAVSTIPTPVAPQRDAPSIARANTGAGSLVDVEAYSDDRTERRNSSGVTAALSEAALIDDEIAELRSPSITPRDDTAAGQLAPSAFPMPELEEEATQDGHGADLRSAIIQRQSRRRVVTQSVVLYDQDGDTARGHSVSFAEDSEQSVPALADAGQLDHEGASDLFGVLSVLDDEPGDLGFAEDEELSMETDARFYADLSESVSRVRTETPPPRASSEQAQAEEYGSTSLGSLTPDDTGQGPMIDYGPGNEEITASVTDGQVLSVSQLDIRLSPGVSDPEPAGMSGIELEFTDEGPLEELGFSGTIDPSTQGELLDDPGVPGRFSEYEEPTQEQSHDDALVPPGTFRANDDDVDMTSGERPSHRGGLVSDSFDFGAGQQERWRDAYPEDGGTPDLPVRPVSMQHAPEGVEATASQMLAPVGPEPKRRGNQSVLRAVVERQRVAKERNRAPKAATGTAGDSNKPAPAMAAPAAGSLASARAAPSVGEVYPPARQPSQPASKKWTIVTYLVVPLAVALAVAAAVSTLWPADNQAPLPAQPELRGGLVDAPAELRPATPAQPPTEAALSPDAGAAPTNAAAAVPEPALKKTAPPPEPKTEIRPAPKRRPKPARTTRRRSRPRRRRASPPPAPKVDKAKSVLRMKCSEPVDIRISTVGTRKNQTNFKETLKPGWYRVKLYRNGDRIEQLDVNLLPGQSLSLPCP